MKTREEILEICKGDHSNIKHVERTQNISGGCGTYSFKSDVFEIDGDFIEMSLGRTSQKAITPAEYLSDDAQILKIERVEKYYNKWWDINMWRCVEVLYEQEKIQ